MDDPLTVAQVAAAELRRRAGLDRLDVAVVLGSGWKGAVERFGESVADLATTELPGFAAAGVVGHQGRVQAFDRDGQRVLAFLGRTHLYEGHGVAAVAVGGQFVDLSDLYAARLRAIAKQVDETLREGVYAHWPGPAFETPAEIRMLRTLGADLVGMSTVPEAIAAHALGVEVLAISLPTNWAAGMTEQKLSHLEVIEMGEKAAPRCAALLSGILDRL